LSIPTVTKELLDNQVVPVGPGLVNEMMII